MIADWLTGLTVTDGIIVAAIAALGAVAVARINRSPYAALARRVAELEQADRDKGEVINGLREQITKALTDRAALIEYVRAWWTWANAGSPPPPPPVPAELHDLLDPALAHVAQVAEVRVRYTVPEHDDPEED